MTTEGKLRICVDFDNTIYDGVGILPGCVEGLLELQKTYSVAIFTARATDPERRQMAEVLYRNNIPHDEILPPKPEAAFYLDDKGRRFEGWDKIKL